MDLVTVPLRRPLRFGGKDVSELTIRRSNMGDQEDALQMAIRMKRPANAITIELAVFAVVCGVPYDALRELSEADMAALRTGYNQVNGVAEEEETDPTSGTPPSVSAS